eukprot:m.147614 g.147614  ORF g.147614 m.147614 type:complete len:370 (-) comp30549_c0_seq1:157-1266(-)
MSLPDTMRALTTRREGSQLIFSVQEISTPTIKQPTDVIVKIDACPINPSDLGNIGMVAKFGGTGPTLDLPEGFKSLPDGFSMQCGNEGSGVVVAAGTSPEAQALVGTRVAILTGKNYAQYAKANATAEMFTVVPDNVTAVQSASIFVNPLTVVGFVDTMRVEGHTALVHTAAASQLGRMLVKYCKKLNIGLVNIVRKESSAKILKGLGAEYVVVSTAPTYKADLEAAITATKATLAFDAVRGGTLAYEIVVAMEKALKNNGVVPHPAYGTNVHKQVYTYGGLGSGDCVLPSGMGMSWGIGGWLMPFHFEKTTTMAVPAALALIVPELTTTFSTTFGKHLSLDDVVTGYMGTLKSHTDEKFLVCPNGEVV